MKRTLSIFLIVIATVAAITLVIPTSSSKEEYITIGILQTASHPALDASREGFTQVIKEKFGEKVHLRYQNAEGLLHQAQSIANSFHRDSSVKAIFTIATPATQAMCWVEKKKPIVFSAVTDPYALGILDGSTNVTGVQDMIDVDLTLDLINSLLPTAKTVAVLFNPGEINSVSILSIMKEKMLQRGLIPLEIGVHQEADVASAVMLACKSADVILTPTDNLVASTMSLIAKLAQQMKTPLIVSDNLLVVQGALASRGVDYFESGKKSASSLLQMLQEESKPPILKPSMNNIYIHRQLLSVLEISLPSNIPEEMIVWIE